MDLSVNNDKQFPSSLQSREGWARYLELRRTPEPHLHQIEPTNHCLYSCIMCPRPKKMTREKGFMEFELFSKVIDEVSSYSGPLKSREIELFHFGESLLHTGIDRMVGYVSGKRLRATLSVNGPQLHPELAGRLLAANPYRVVVSLDGYDQESYRAIRGDNADYPAAVNNIRAFIALHKKMKSTALISVRMILLYSNEEHVSTFRKQWEDTGITVEIRKFFPWGDAEMSGLGSFTKYPPHMPCPFSWQYLVVQWNGDIVPCCRDYNAVNKLGNVRESSLKEIWNGKAYQEFRRQMTLGEFKDNKICPNCLNLYYNDSGTPD